MGEGSDAGPHDRVPAETAAAWQQGEERLYLAALGDVDRYRRTMELVGVTVEYLRRRGPGVPELLASAAQGGGLVTEAAPDAAGPDIRLVADAALALRHREVLAEQTARRRLQALDEARHRGEDRVVLEVSGVSAGDPFRPYRRLEAEVATGHALLVSTAPDEEFRGCVHMVEALRVDLGTGAVLAADDDRVTAVSSADEHAREHAATQAWAAMTGACAPPPRSP